MTIKLDESDNPDREYRRKFGVNFMDTVHLFTFSTNCAGIIISDTKIEIFA